MLKGPQYDTLKAVIIIVLVIGAGYFATNFYQKNGLSGRGQVVDTSGEVISQGSQTQGEEFVFDVNTSGGSCTVTVCQASDIRNCITMTGTPSGEKCEINETQATPEAQGLADILK